MLKTLAAYTLIADVGRLRSRSVRRGGDRIPRLTPRYHCGTPILCVSAGSDTLKDEPLVSLDQLTKTDQRKKMLRRTRLAVSRRV
jgi:hypothetical protein